MPCCASVAASRPIRARGPPVPSGSSLARSPRPTSRRWRAATDFLEWRRCMALIDTGAALATYGRQPKPAPEALVNAHLSLVRKIAWHVHGRVSSAVEIEDLVQSGMVALIEAANAFEDRGHAFSTYATMRIR